MTERMALIVPADAAQLRRLYWLDDNDVCWPLNNESFPRVAAQIGVRCERSNERLGHYEAGWPPAGVVVAAVARLLFRNWPNRGG